jgi:hypothetical protein
MDKTNRWHPVMLPDDYHRKMRRALGEVEAEVEARVKVEVESGTKVEVEVEVESGQEYIRPGSGSLRRATSESYYEPFPDNPPPPDDEQFQPSNAED